MSVQHAAPETGLVQVERRERLLLISMQRAKKRNAINRAMADELDAALNMLDDDDSIWAGVLTGTDSIFSAGSDLTCNGDYVTERGGEYGIIRRERKKPLVAAVEGMALGGGMEIALACDLIVASREARFGLPEVSIGVIPTCAALFRAPNALPLNVARQLILTGDPIGAERAFEIGLVNELTDPGRAANRALEIAQRISRNAPLSVQGCLQTVNEYIATGDDLGWRLHRTHARACSAERRHSGGRSLFPRKASARVEGPVVTNARARFLLDPILFVASEFTQTITDGQRRKARLLAAFERGDVLPVRCPDMTGIRICANPLVAIG